MEGDYTVFKNYEEEVRLESKINELSKNQVCIICDSKTVIGSIQEKAFCMDCAKLAAEYEK